MPDPANNGAVPSELHFTYNKLDPTSLHQGDVIRRTEAVEGILQNVHPHYFNKMDYRYFIILTQSCDLIRREKGRCPSRYITIAAVRPVELALEREAERFLYEDVERKLRIGPSSRKSKLIQFMERLLNNNEDRYFFLQREPSCGFHEDHCAFLQLSISLKSELHYPALLAAKLLQLKESFQHKLGYLVGSAYSRVGTEDWPSDATFRKKTLFPVVELETITWIEDPVYKQVIKRLKELPEAQQTLEKMVDLVKQIGKGKDARRKEVLNLISESLTDLRVDHGVIEQLRRQLENRPEFRANIK